MAPTSDDRAPYTSLSCGALGIGPGFETALAVAEEYGYGGIEPDVRHLRQLTGDQTTELRSRLDKSGLRWGSAGVPVNLHAGASEFARQLAGLESYAEVLAAAGADRAGTWIRPMSNDLTYRRNFARHVERIGLIDEILGAAGVRFGLEYVGPKTMWSTERYPFVHTLAELRELLTAVGSANAGVVLDSFHWYTSGESVDDLLRLSPEQVVAVDLNDAPAGLDRDEQQDGTRTLPGVTNVIDLPGFVGALRKIGYAGPIKVEPFDVQLAKLPHREVVAKVAASLTATLGSPAG